MTSLMDAMPRPFEAGAAFDAIAAWSAAGGRPLYEAQEEAIFELVAGAHVILATPTGSGKSLVAVAAHAIALAQGQRSYYTAPIKALVSEKFFQLVEIFGADNVGMVTGDSAVNGDAPIICCTAEIVANLTLRQGADLEAGLVVMDEFHYYAEPERGWAWQVPLLTLTGAQFLLMSATLGDMSAIADDLHRRTERPVSEVTHTERPIPLSFEYVRTPVHETVERLLDERQAPVYVVHFSQAAAMERAQALSSIRIVSREQRDEIAAAIGDFRFSTGFGSTLSRLVRAGIGVHHAGMLPKYRRLVEVLAQRGLLRVICGTDTLGVGINVPIRTVLITALSKYDGVKTRQLSAREFHQIAGRAGRAGYDTSGLVVVQAPDHEIENHLATTKAGDDPKKRKKIVRKSAPAGFVTWSETSFERLVGGAPEPLESRMQVSAAMLINLIARGGDVLGSARALLTDNHEPPHRQRELVKRALGIAKTLVRAGVVVIDRDGADGAEGREREPRIRLTVDLQPNFALNQPLSPFALAVIELLDPAETQAAGRDATGSHTGGIGTGHYALDVVSVIESTLENPRPVLSQQQFKARGEAVAGMKADGIEYEQRMELLDEVEHPQPLGELLREAFETFAASQPWIRDVELKPKSVVRDMFERAMTFSEYVSFYGIARSEGLLLRYLSDADRAIRQTVPDEAKTEELRDIIAWLGELVRQVDSSLLDEWEALSNPQPEGDEPVIPPAPPSVLTNRRAFLVLVRNELFRRVQLAALQRDDELEALDPQAAWPDALDAYYADHESIGTAGNARSASLIRIDETPTDAPGTWRVRQVIDDPAGDHDWGIDAVVDLAASAEQGVAVVRVEGLNRL
ncbi:RNA helicase [Yonghaparkia sp. Root332]|uniref:DEAD/DEAH box helicase n=1 Tax=Yonghaparkia sp. Root332 TaxID=1736516 RepID=UPI0006F2DA17|nr:DEAD/DEAH box helicase [Yonghaparkia sp. Root332]KQV24844.1 DEAD/DEAH box helicase [Yonghaparkia sp. Root332]